MESTGGLLTCTVSSLVCGMCSKQTVFLIMFVYVTSKSYHPITLYCFVVHTIQLSRLSEKFQRRCHRYRTVSHLNCCENHVRLFCSRRVGESPLLPLLLAGLGEFRIRDLNDEINKLLREKRHWQDRIVELGGPDYSVSLTLLPLPTPLLLSLSPIPPYIVE